jgi:hypothetical protein
MQRSTGIWGSLFFYFIEVTYTPMSRPEPVFLPLQQRQCPTLQSVYQAAVVCA